MRAGGGKIIPKDPKARIAALTLQALCDGILDAGILLVYEGRWRPPEMAVQKWIDHQRGKVERAFAVLEAAPPTLDAIPNVGAITLACALGYSDLRFERKWRGESSETGEVARRVCREGAGVREDARDRLSESVTKPHKKPRTPVRGFFDCVAVAVSTSRPPAPASNL